MSRPSGDRPSAAPRSPSVSYRTSAIGWTPIALLMMNSRRARPTPSFGINDERERLVGIRHVHHDPRDRPASRTG